VTFQLTSSDWRGHQRTELREWAAPFWGPFRMEGGMMQRELAREVPLVGLSDVGGVTRRATPGPILNRRREQSSAAVVLREMYDMYHERKKSEKVA
jgi:hypothetical protein